MGLEERCRKGSQHALLISATEIFHAKHHHPEQRVPQASRMPWTCERTKIQNCGPGKGDNFQQNCAHNAMRAAGWSDCGRCCLPGSNRWTLNDDQIVLSCKRMEDVQKLNAVCPFRNGTAVGFDQTGPRLCKTLPFRARSQRVETMQSWTRCATGKHNCVSVVERKGHHR